MFRLRVVVQQKSTRNRKRLVAAGNDVTAAADDDVNGAGVDQSLNVLLDTRLDQVRRT